MSWYIVVLYIFGLSRSLWLRICEYRAFVARMTNRHGHWVCWMSMGGKNSFKHTASSSVERVVEVTAKRRLFLVTSVTPISRRYMEKNSNELLFALWKTKKEQKRKKETYNTRIWLSATLDLFHACLLALSHSGRHKRTALCTLLLCPGPIEGCSAVLTVRRYCCGFRWLVCAFVVCAEKAGSKTKLRGCVARRPWLAELIQLWPYLSNKSTSPAVMSTWRLVLPSAIWLGPTRASACVANMLRSLTQTHTRALLWCCCIAVVMALWYYVCCLALR